MQKPYCMIGRSLMCISQFTQTQQVFQKLLMLFHKQKKFLGLQHYQIFNQGSFFWGGGGGAKRIPRTSEEILATPLKSKYLCKTMS